MTTNSRHKDRDYLEVYQEVTRLISMLHDPQRVMDLVVRRLPELLEVDAATIRLLDHGTNTFLLGAAWGVSDEYLNRTTIDSKDVLDALMQGQPSAKSDVNLHCDHDSCVLISKEGVKGTMTLPILYKGEVIGMMRLLTKTAQEFSEAEISFAMSLAEQIGIAITNSRLFQEQQNQLTFFKELRAISRMVNSTLDLDQVLKSIVDLLPRIMGLKGCTIRLVDAATNRLELVAASGLSEGYLSRGSISKEDTIFKALKGEPVAIYDATKDSRVTYHRQIEAEGIKSILAVPIKNERDVIGVLRLLSSRHHFFTQGEIHFAVTAAEEGGNAIQKARTYRKITLLFNQIEEHERFLQTIMDSLWLSVLVIDSAKRVVMANKMFIDNQDIEETELLGKNYASISPWFQFEKEHHVDQVLQTGAPVAILEEIEKDGRIQWFERHLTPITEDEGEIRFVIEAVRDITDQRLLEKEKMEKMKLQGVVEMAGTAAHELNSPLFAALGTAQLLRDDLPTEEMLNEMDMIIRNMKKMAKLTREMTTVTGFESREYVGDTKLVKLKTDPR